MFKLIYVSSARRLLSSDDLLDIMTVSRRYNKAVGINNKAVGITGILFYCEGSFMQLLEGDENEVRLLFEKISTDARHKDIHLLSTLHASGLWMEDWSMAFSHCAHPGELQDIVDLASGLDGVDALIDDEAPLKPILLGFVERNLRLAGQ